MFHKVAVVAVIASIVVCQMRADEKVLGPADVMVKHVDKCPNHEIYSYPVEVIRTKLSRFQDAFSGNMTIDKPMDELMGMYVNINKYGDGGWKNIYVMDQNNACAYFMEQFEENFKMILEKMGAPQKCPVAAGSYSIQDFTVDYKRLPENLTYGYFEIFLYLTGLSNKRMSCIRCYVDITPKKEE